MGGSSKQVVTCDMLIDRIEKVIDFLCFPSVSHFLGSRLFFSTVQITILIGCISLYVGLLAISSPLLAGWS